ncbi:putative ribonuclease H-like domain-containing protein [Tanacetum coccineum]|uniref:Ribonuclease H-like domain-containing protein n=1 Tax=Tanacetum coccineum TaxID=301880 RepID=A0ABQ5GE56_9ASTR
MPNLEEIVYSDDDEEVGAEADMNNLATTVPVSSIPTTRVHKDHPLEQIIGDIQSTPQTRRMIKSVTEHGVFSSVQQRINHKYFHNCLFACFQSQVEPKKATQALTDLRWIEAMQDELLQFKLQKVWTLVELPYGKRAIGTKWVYRNKKDYRGIVVRNKARLVVQGYTQEEGIDYDVVFAPVARIEAIRLFLAYASFMGFIVYQMDVKSAFLYGTIEEEVYVCQPPGFEDLQFPNKVYKVEKALYDLHQALRAWYETLSTYLLENGFKRVKQKDDGIFISQDKYVADILKKFDFATVKTTSTPIETNKALLKDEEAEDVDVHLYISLIYLKGQPKLGLWYPRDSPFDLEAFSDSDYARASLDRKSTTGGCQFLGKRLISWQCKKQTIVANSTTEAEYVAAANCYGQVLWIQNQMLDYGFNFMNTKIHIDNESTICIVKNPVFHSKTKHIEIRHHFIRDSYEKRLIQVIKIHTDHNVADLLTKAFDVSSDEFGVKTGSCKVNAARQDLVLLGEKGNADFHQIVDFLNASTIRYSLTISPTIYASYIEQFWATAKSKIVNNETQIHAKVDGKTIVISESSVRSNLHFNDEDGVTSLTNSKILENLALMGYEIVSDKLTFQKAFFSPQWKYLIHTILHCLSSKSTAWNEFSTNIASAVICLANNQKFNFSKLIFNEPFNDTNETPKHFQKVFANMRRKGKSFSGTVTLLFQSMLAIQAIEGKVSGQPSEPQPTPSPALPSHVVTTVASHPQKTHTPRRAKRGEDDRVVRAATTATSLEAEHKSGNIHKTRSTATINEPYPQGSGLVNTSGSREDSMEHQDDLTDFVPPTRHDSPLLGGYTPRSDEGRPNINKLMAICTKLSNKVLALETSKTAQDLVIKKLKKKVKRLEKKLRERTSGMKLFKIGTSRRKSLDKENVSKQGRNLKTRPMFEEGDFDDDFNDIDDMVNEVMENVEGDIINASGVVNTATTGVSAASASVTTTGVSISTAEPRTPPTTTTTAFEDEDLTIAQTLVKMRSQKDKEKGKGPKKPPKNLRKAQIQIDEELAMRLHKEEKAALERMQRDRAEQEEASNVALTAEFDDVQARMDVDALLAARLQEEERE